MSAVEISPCKYSWALDGSERRSGSTTSVEKRKLGCLGWPVLIDALRRSHGEHERNRLEASVQDWHYAENPRW